MIIEHDLTRMARKSYAIRMAAKRIRYGILVIDDDRLISVMVGQMLHRVGYSSVVCTRRPLSRTDPSLFHLIQLLLSIKGPHISFPA